MWRQVTAIAMFQRRLVIQASDSNSVLSIFCSMRQQFIAAHFLIFAGYEFDRFDGIVARRMKQCSDWGKELDSFSDMVCSDKTTVDLRAPSPDWAQPSTYQ